MTPGLLTILTFLACVFTVIGIYSILSDVYLKDRAVVQRRLSEEFRQTQREQVKRSRLFRNPENLQLDDDATLSRNQRLGHFIEQSGLNLTVQRFLGITVIVAISTAALVFLISNNLLLTLILAALSATTPYLYVLVKWKARMRKLVSQLPDAFDLMSRVIRAGQTTSQAVQAVADEFAQPLAGEFNYCAEQQNLGLSPEAAFRDLARRTGLLEIKIFVMGLLVQQQTGGNLAEVLDKLAGVIRERFRMKGKIQALTAEGRMQGLVLIILPFAVLGLMMLMNSNYAQTVYAHPGLLVLMLAMVSIGGLWIRKVVNFDF